MVPEGSGPRNLILRHTPPTFIQHIGSGWCVAFLTASELGARMPTSGQSEHHRSQRCGSPSAFRLVVSGVKEEEEMMIRGFRAVLLCAVMLAVWAPPAHAQAIGSIFGKVTDVSGG